MGISRQERTKLPFRRRVLNRPCLSNGTEPAGRPSWNVSFDPFKFNDEFKNTVYTFCMKNYYIVEVDLRLKSFIVLSAEQNA